MFIEIIFTRKCIPERQGAFILITDDIKEEFTFYNLMKIDAQKMCMIIKRIDHEKFLIDF